MNCCSFQAFLQRCEMKDKSFRLNIYKVLYLFISFATLTWSVTIVFCLCKTCFMLSLPSVLRWVTIVGLPSANFTLSIGFLCIRPTPVRLLIIFHCCKMSSLQFLIFYAKKLFLAKSISVLSCY